MENVKIDNRLKLIDRPHKIKIDDNNIFNVLDFIFLPLQINSNLSFPYIIH